MARRTRYTDIDEVKFRPVMYEGPDKKIDSDVGVDILTLYITCGLGYSPIRHILRLKNDKLIEDVIRQHRLGRSITSKPGYERECRLRCPRASKLDEVSTQIIKRLVEKYNSISDDYVYLMLTTGSWKDDPVTSDYYKCECGFELEKEFEFCPKCGKRLKIHRTRKFRL